MKDLQVSNCIEPPIELDGKELCPDCWCKY